MCRRIIYDPCICSISSKTEIDMFKFGRDDCKISSFLILCYAMYRRCRTYSQSQPSTSKHRRTLLAVAAPRFMSLLSTQPPNRHQLPQLLCTCTTLSLSLGHMTAATVPAWQTGSILGQRNMIVPLSPSIAATMRTQATQRKCIVTRKTSRNRRRQHCQTRTP
jgi:hypothetical protein